MSTLIKATTIQPLGTLALYGSCERPRCNQPAEYIGLNPLRSSLDGVLLCTKHAARRFVGQWATLPYQTPRRAVA